MSSIRQMLVLVGDSEPATLELVRASLGGSGFTVAAAGNGEDSVDYVRRQPVELVLLDLHIPGLSGIEACWQIRAASPGIRIVMLTRPGSEDDMVRALEAGADDCIAKPFQIRELVARLKAMLRRTPACAERPFFKQAPEGTNEPGGWRLDFERCSLWKAGQEISLSPKEFDVLAALMKNEGVAMSRAELLRAAWGPKCDEAQHLRTYIRRLRRKLEDDPAQPQCLLTEPWIGYRFCRRAQASTHATSLQGAPGRMPVAHGLPAAHGMLRCQLPRYNQAKLQRLRIDRLRGALRANEISFPNPLPTFVHHDRPDLQWRLVLLYFVRGWHCEAIASRYGLLPQRVHQILKAWARRAIESGYVEYFPPYQVLGEMHPPRPGAAVRQAAEPLRGLFPGVLPAGIGASYSIS